MIKGRVKFQTPFRQYEYLAIEYDFEGTGEKDEAIRTAISDCKALHHYVSEKNITRKKIEGTWHHYCPEEKVWKVGYNPED